MNRVNPVTISCLVITLCTRAFAAESILDLSPPPDQRQLPKAMHSAMSQLPHITVGIKDCDLIGNRLENNIIENNRATRREEIARRFCFRYKNSERIIRYDDIE